jgi:hypothetical protein
MMVASI